MCLSLGITEMHPAYVHDIKRVRLCILESEHIQTQPPSPIPTQRQPRLVCVATLKVQSNTKPKLKVTLSRQEKCPEGCGHLGLLDWRLSISYCHFLVFDLCQKRAASTECAKATNVCVSAQRLKFHMRKVQFSRYYSSSVDCSKTAHKDFH